MWDAEGRGVVAHGVQSLAKVVAGGVGSWMMAHIRNRLVWQSVVLHFNFACGIIWALVQNWNFSLWVLQEAIDFIFRLFVQPRVLIIFGNILYSWLNPAMKRSVRDASGEFVNGGLVSPTHLYRLRGCGVLSLCLIADVSSIIGLWSRPYNPHFVLLFENLKSLHTRFLSLICRPRAIHWLTWPRGRQSHPRFLGRGLFENMPLIHGKFGSLFVDFCLGFG